MKETAIGNRNESKKGRNIEIESKRPTAFECASIPCQYDLPIKKKFRKK